MWNLGFFENFAHMIAGKKKFVRQPPSAPPIARTGEILGQTIAMIIGGMFATSRTITLCFVGKLFGTLTWKKSADKSAVIERAITGYDAVTTMKKAILMHWMRISLSSNDESKISAAVLPKIK